MGNLQQFGRALMLPMIALPAAAILLSLSKISWESIGWGQFGEILHLAGDSIFTYLPFIFAIGVAVGLTENAGFVGMAAAISYFIFTKIVDYYLPGFQLGVPGGIIIGWVTAVSYNRFKDIRFPEFIQFFGGPRFIPLFMSFFSIFLAYFVIWIGPLLQSWMSKIHLLLELGGFGAFLYGMLYRLLVPTGLHHILNNVAWFQVGMYEREDGQIVYGDIPRFFAGDPEAGIYMAGLYPIMMFAIPAIALAIIREAREDLRPKIRATFLTAALTSFLTGVTEPIEFAFLFVAPVLFLVHAVLSGVAMWITYALDIHHGFAFSAGVIDFLINKHLAQNEHLLLAIGLVYGLMYYLLFRWAIRRFQIPTPGREEGTPLEEWAGDLPLRAPLILQALGGKDNIVKMEACITRLRLTLQNVRGMDVKALKNLGAAGVIHLGGNNVQVVFGTFSELIREEIMRLMRKEVLHVHFCSPVQGRMIPLSEVPDPVFSEQIAGKGVAFLPEKGELVSPVHGNVVHIHPAGHALGIRTPEGLDVLIHVGIDSMGLESVFQLKVREGDEVVSGQSLMRFDLSKLKKQAKSPVIPVVITNPDKVLSWSYGPFKAVNKGQASVMSVALQESDINGGFTNA